MTLTIRRGLEGSAVSEVEIDLKKTLVIEIKRGSVIIYRKDDVPNEEKDRLIVDSPTQNFQDAYIDLAASLLDHNLPSYPDIPEEVNDKYNAFDKAFNAIVKSYQGNTHRINLAISLTTADLEKLIRFNNIPKAKWEHCHRIIGARIINILENIREGR